ncbi:hypothetical protein P3W85_34440 [Cupriavidus basilensis]|uniref:Uncharacterized protein n=1 Tax=Cupriavidus basilensis TaxID=68895 RepID=A0ABT6AZG4_9BURK|nr:hypothetical protein [Cupriavidus basilensis]MDF3837995.1 hypothetical protein [Cupriavidus basilensis]
MTARFFRPKPPEPDLAVAMEDSGKRAGYDRRDPGGHWLGHFLDEHNDQQDRR